MAYEAAALTTPAISAPLNRVVLAANSLQFTSGANDPLSLIVRV